LARPHNKAGERRERLEIGQPPGRQFPRLIAALIACARRTWPHTFAAEANTCVTGRGQRSERACGGKAVSPSSPPSLSNLF
jgi:hypothetical protein